LERRHERVVRVNAERLCEWEAELIPGRSWCLARGERSLDSKDCRGIWWRRPDLSFLSVSDSLDPAEEEVVRDQWRALLLGLESVSGPRWVSSPRAIRAAEDKARQLSLAADLGLPVPRTLWTNSLASARQFLGENEEAAAKSVTSAWWEKEGAGWFVFAGRVNAVDLPPRSSLAGAPIAFQTPIDPKRDVRVTVVGGQALAAVRDTDAADPQEASILDWRVGGDLPWMPHELPADPASRCAELVASLGLEFGAIDLLLEPDGRYWFCEINPNGEWGWLQQIGLPIAEALASRLLDG
jgi:glutathione synthase/RimK-type ligase-like ATP-grasp enzyme